jgi:predicted outer membrane protein
MCVVFRVTDRNLRRAHIALLAVSAVVLAGSAVMTQTPLLKPLVDSALAKPPAPRAKLALPPEADRRLVEAARAAVVLSPELRRLAHERAEHPAVRGFMQDAPIAGASLLSDLPHEAQSADSGSPNPARDMLELLSRLRGPAFDRVLMDAEIQQRQRLVDLTEQQARAGRHAELRHLAQRSLNTQRIELIRAHAVAAEIASIVVNLPPSQPKAPSVPMLGGPIGPPSQVQFNPSAIEIPPSAVAAPRNMTTDLNLRELERISLGN